MDKWIASKPILFYRDVLMLICQKGGQKLDNTMIEINRKYFFAINAFSKPFLGGNKTNIKVHNNSI